MATKPPVRQTAKPQILELSRTLDDSEEEIQVRVHRSPSSSSHNLFILLQALLLSSKIDEDCGKAHDLIASLLTRHRGEYVFRIGALPPLSHLISGEPIEDTGWIGVTRTQAEVNKLHEMTVKVVEQMGGKVSTLFESRTDHPRIHLLLRLPPLSISDVPEVRCAVVGNVDSGKSTTLGVLTRGMFSFPWSLLLSYRRKGALDDGRGRARVALFRHKHEIESGRTSSVGMEVRS